MNATVTYTRYEVLRTVRNRYFFVLSLVFPLVLYFSIAGSNRHARIDGIPFPLYYMAGMIGFGAMAAVLAGGSRIALERSVGWTRQVRITPLSGSAYLRAKVTSSFLTAIVSIVLLGLAGLSLGVSLGVGRWLLMGGLVLVGLVPFAVLGILLGLLLSADAMGPALGGMTSFFALLGGAFGPLFTSGVLLDVVKLLPSYWIVQAAESALRGRPWPAEGWLVILAWTLVLLRLAVIAYRRSTATG